MISPDRYAERVLDQLAIRDPKDLALLEAIAWERRVLVVERPLAGAEARIAIAGRRGIVTISTSITDPRRKRFSIAHELGHFEMHRWDNPLALCTQEDLNNWDLRPAAISREQEANAFASALLLPERFFAPLCKDQPPALDLISGWAEDFDVSLTATALRYMRYTHEPCAVVYSKKGISKWFQASQEFEGLGLFVEVGVDVNPSTGAALLFRGRSAAATQKRVKASAWLAPGRYHKHMMIQEQSWPMPSYSATLTLLWVNEGVDEDFEELEDD